MGLQLSAPEFGPPGSPVSSAIATPQIDAAWFVNFDDFSASSLEVGLSAIGKSDSFLITAPKIQVWASPSPTDITGATLLAEVDMPIGGTGGNYVGEDASAVVVNPGGKRYLVLTSQNGSG